MFKEISLSVCVYSEQIRCKNSTTSQLYSKQFWSCYRNNRDQRQLSLSLFTHLHCWHCYWTAASTFSWRDADGLHIGQQQIGTSPWWPYPLLYQQLVRLLDFCGLHLGTIPIHSYISLHTRDSAASSDSWNASRILRTESSCTQQNYRLGNNAITITKLDLQNVLSHSKLFEEHFRLSECTVQYKFVENGRCM